MAFYVQYDEAGNVSATINTSGDAPDFPRQLTFDSYVQTSGQVVNLDTLELEDAPPAPTPTETP